MIKAVISQNPHAEQYNEIERVNTFDFTHSVQALKVLLHAAKQVKTSSNPTPLESVMAECAMQIGEALQLNQQ